MNKPIIVSILEIIGGSLSIIAAGKIAKDSRDTKRMNDLKKANEARAKESFNNSIKYNGKDS